MSAIQVSHQHFDPNLYFGVDTIRLISDNEHCSADQSAAVMVSNLKSMTELASRVYSELLESPVPFFMDADTSNSYKEAKESVVGYINNFDSELSWAVSDPCYVEFTDVSNAYLRLINKFEKFNVPFSKNTPNAKTARAINDPESEVVADFRSWLDENT